MAVELSELPDGLARLLANDVVGILRQMVDGVIVASADGAIVFVNDAATRLHGVARLDVGPEDYSAIYHLFTLEGRPFPSEDLPLARAVRGETVTDAHWTIRRPDGSQVMAIGSARPLLDAAGARVGAMLVMRDDTRRLATDRALRDAEERYRLVAMVTNDAIWDWDLATGRITWTDTMQRVYGHAPKALVTTYGWWLERVHADDRARVDKGIGDIRAGRSSTWSDEYRFLRGDGSVACVHDRAVAVRDASGEVVRLVGAMLDVTRHRHDADAAGGQQATLRGDPPDHADT
jgi:PAS domain S-box-containing protein